MSDVNDVGDDEYVAKLLAEDAKKDSLRYSAMGLSALFNKRPVNTAPKPNTRFLKNLVQEADNHNAALKKREEFEARQRLRKVNTMIQGPPSILNGRKVNKPRSRHEDRYERRKDRSNKSRDASFERQKSPDTNQDRIRRKRNHQNIEDFDDERDRRKSVRKYHKSESKFEEERYNHRSGFSGSRTRLSSSPDLDSQHKGSRLKSMGNSSERPPNGESVISYANTTDHSRRNVPPDHATERGYSQRLRSRSVSSDPLEVIVGPLPVNASTGSNNDLRNRPRVSPTRRRGRGAYKPSQSSIDMHFSKDYEPAFDVHPGSEGSDEGEDWDMALEALRDRQQWKQRQIHRLREAGFGDEEIHKWSESGKEKTASGVKWRQKGEAREWDLGKPELNNLDDQDKKARHNKTIEGLTKGWKRKESAFQKAFRKALE